MNTFHFNINDGYYRFRRNKWMINPAFHLKTYKSEKIDRPIFLVGNQGDGLTLVSRILRRHKSVVNVTGNANYWAGADEMQRVFNEFLPAELCYNHRSLKPSANNFSLQKGWLYASNEQLDVFRSTSADSRTGKKIASCYAILFASIPYNWFISVHDKSQIYSVKVGLLNDLLSETLPTLFTSPETHTLRFIAWRPFKQELRHLILLCSKNPQTTLDQFISCH